MSLPFLPFLPMRAVELPDISYVRYPIYVSDKIDGIYCALINSPRAGARLAATKSVKMIPNLSIRHTIQNSALPVGLIGELVVNDNFHDTSSAVRTITGAPIFKWYLHDYLDGSIPLQYQIRLQRLQVVYEQYHKHYPWIQLLDQRSVGNAQALELYEQDAINRGMEGVMLRSPFALYKRGLSTLRVQSLMKWKRFTDAEAKVISFTELELSNGSGGNTLGALVVEDCETHTQFQIGSGFTNQERREIWNNKERFINNILTYKYQKHGTKDKPRSPIFRRWRTDIAL